MAEAIALEEAPGEGPPVDPSQAPKGHPDRMDWLIGAGWLGTGMALTGSELPLNALLKNQLHLSPEQTALFLAIVNIPIYIKPFAGILSDAFPLFGTRRRHYLILSLLLGGLGWIVLGLVPKTLPALGLTYLVLNLFLVLASTVLGGLMVEVGKHHSATGRLSAQRVGLGRFVQIVATPIGGQLAKGPFALAMAFCGAMHLILVPLFTRLLPEPRTARTNLQVFQDAREQLRVLFTSGTLWSAAGLVVLVVAAPGFKTPLFYYQQNTLGFDTGFIGNLGIVTGICGIAGAIFYGRVCRRYPLRQVLAGSIVLHALLALFYLAYNSPTSAMIVTGIESITFVLAVLPLYDLAARATPKGSEALGYSLMMSVWNFTISLSDMAGSWVFQKFGQQFHALVWVNAGTTLLVLFAVPFLPAVLVDRRDGDR